MRCCHGLQAGLSFNLQDLQTGEHVFSWKNIGKEKHGCVLWGHSWNARDNLGRKRRCSFLLAFLDPPKPTARQYISPYTYNCPRVAVGPTWISCGLTSRLTGLRWLAKYLAKDAKYANCLFSALSNCISKCNPAGQKNEKIEDCFWILWKCLAIFSWCEETNSWQSVFGHLFGCLLVRQAFDI